MNPGSAGGIGTAGRSVGSADRDELARLGEAFADPTRRDLFRRVNLAAAPLSAGELAAASGLHRTVVRTHLERLVELGLLEISLRRTGRGGRPAKLYGPGGTPVELTIPERRYRQLALGLLAVLPVVADDDRALLAAVRQAGLEEGKAAAVDSVAEAVAWLNHRGYRASVTDGDGAAVLELGNCVFAHPATVSPEVVCAYDQALLRGLFEDSGAALRQLASVVDGEPLCRMELLLPG